MVFATKIINFSLCLHKKIENKAIWTIYVGI